MMLLLYRIRFYFCQLIFVFDPILAINVHVYNFRIGDLELAIDKMRQQQDTLQKRLKEEVERKTKLEVN